MAIVKDQYSDMVNGNRECLKNHHFLAGTNFLRGQLAVLKVILLVFTSFWGIFLCDMYDFFVKMLHFTETCQVLAGALGTTEHVKIRKKEYSAQVTVCTIIQAFFPRLSRTIESK